MAAARAQHEGRAQLWTLRAWPGGWRDGWSWDRCGPCRRPWRGRCGGQWSHHVPEELEGGRGAAWAPGGQTGGRACSDPAHPPSPQNASRDLLGEALAQHIRQQIDARGDHPLSRYSLAGAWGHGTGTAHVSVLGADGSAVAATSTINTPCVSPEAGGQAPLFSPQT